MRTTGTRTATLTGLVVALLGTLVPAGARGAELPAGTARIGYLAPIAQPVREDVFRQELRRLGHVEGQNLAIEYRSADGRLDRLPALAAELVRLRVDLIVAVVTQAALAAQKATSTIPIVMVGVADPVGLRLVASLARPGGNVTGTSTIAADVVGKQIEVLREMLPGLSRVGAVWNPGNPAFQRRVLEEVRTAATRLRLQLHAVEARRPEDLDRAVAAIVRQRADALFVLPDPVLAAHFARIAGLAVRHRLPVVGASRQTAEDGALMAYGPDYLEGFRRAAAYVDRILKGDRPASLPVEQTTKFELVINARTARALGVTVPQSLVLRADHIVQ